MELINKMYHFKYNDQTKRIEGFSEQDIIQIREKINRGEVIILKNCFDREASIEIRKKTFAYFQSNEPLNLPITNDTPNFYRRDNNPEKSAVKRVKQAYNAFYWNKGLGDDVHYLRAMSILRNKIAELPTEYATQQIEPDHFITLSSVAQYPLGGGYLSKHVDPLNKQFCVIISCLSEKGPDFPKGGLYIEVNNERIYLDDEIEIGDVYLMNPSTIHGVEPIDEGDQPEWSNEKGRWILFPSLVELKTLYGEKVKGLKDLNEK